MHKGVQKSWMYVVPLILLGIVATCDSDFTIKNPFNKDDDEDSSQVENVISDTALSSDIDTTNLTGSTIDEDTTGMSSFSNENPRVRKWRIVIGSLKEKGEAQKMASRVEANTELVYVEYLDTYRVVYQSYDDLGQAQKAFSEIQARFPQAWLVYY